MDLENHHQSIANQDQSEGHPNPRVSEQRSRYRRCVLVVFRNGLLAARVVAVGVRDSQAQATNSALQTAATLQTKWSPSPMLTTVEATQIMETIIRWVPLVTKQRLLSDCLTIKQLYKTNLQLTIHKYWAKHLPIVSGQLMAQRTMLEKRSQSKDICTNLRYVLTY